LPVRKKDIHSCMSFFFALFEKGERYNK